VLCRVGAFVRPTVLGKLLIVLDGAVGLEPGSLSFVFVLLLPV